MNSVTNNESTDYQRNNQINTNELFNLQLIKQLLRTIDQTGNDLIQLNKQVFVLPAIKTRKKDQFNKSNSSNQKNHIKLYCTTNAFPSGPVKWYKQISHTNLEPIVAMIDDQTNHYNLEFDSNVLTINNPKIEDSGLFIALISNRLRPDEFNVKCAIQLTVRQPLFVEVNLLNPLNSMKNKDHLDTETVHGSSSSSFDSSSTVHNSIHNSINCTVYGHPVNQIQFYHNGILLDTVLLSSNNFKLLSDEPPIKSYTLSLNPTYSTGNSITEMNGVYQCFAINDYEIETGSYTLMQTRKLFNKQC